MARHCRAFAVAAALAAGVGCATPEAQLPRATPPPEPEAAPLVTPARFVLLRGATVLTAAGPALEGADVLIAGERIAAVGAGLEAPEGARVIDAAGRWVTPGLIDPHSHIGVYPVPALPAHRDGNEATGPFKPEVRAEESVWPQDPAIRRAIAGGVTTIHALPGSANLVGGQGVTLRLTPALSAAAMRFPDAPSTMKMACGENPKRTYGGRGQAPATRMAEVAMLRQRLENARGYEPEPEQAVDHAKLALAGVLSGEILIQNHCYRADEMLLRLSLFDEFGIKPRAFHHAVEAYKIAGELAAAEVAAVVWADWWGSKVELFDAVQAGAALLDAAGVRVSLHSDSAMDIQRMNQQAAKAMAAGRRAGLDVDRARAIRWVTANPAWALGIEEWAGTLEPDKRADVVVWSGDPFSVYTRADLVLIDGEVVFDRSDPASFPVSDFELGLRSAP